MNEILQQIDDVFGLDKVVIVGGMVENYLYNGDFVVSRDIDLALIDDVSDEDMLSKGFQRATASSYISITKKYDTKQWYGRIGEHRYDIFYGDKLDYVSFKYNYFDINLATANHRKRILSEIKDGLVPILNKVQSKLDWYHKVDELSKRK